MNNAASLPLSAWARSRTNLHAARFSSLLAPGCTQITSCNRPPLKSFATSPALFDISACVGNQSTNASNRYADAVGHDNTTKVAAEEHEIKTVACEQPGVPRRHHHAAMAVNTGGSVNYELSGSATQLQSVQSAARVPIQSTHNWKRQPLINEVCRESQRSRCATSFFQQLVWLSACDHYVHAPAILTTPR